MYFKKYFYFTYNTELDSYGQFVENSTPTGTIKLALFLNSQNVNNNPLYADCEYCGKTFDSNIETVFNNSGFRILNGNDFLKAKYIAKVRNYFIVYFQKVN